MEAIASLVKVSYWVTTIDRMVTFKVFLFIVLHFYRVAAGTGSGERLVNPTKEADALEQIQTETGTISGGVSIEFFCDHGNIIIIII